MGFLADSQMEARLERAFRHTAVELSKSKRATGAALSARHPTPRLKARSGAWGDGSGLRLGDARQAEQRRASVARRVEVARFHKADL